MIDASHVSCSNCLKQLQLKTGAVNQHAESGTEDPQFGHLAGSLLSPDFFP